ncbi:MAG: tripartite tricarboxylate transporter substrate binding protein, partial [Elusimicrobia bacterium]|nr:tripartite tricarboxylate transporter substrate binding protein [Elusimicrobiota bacterium]
MTRILLVFASFLLTGIALAQDFPTRPVHIVVPYTPGTGADILARLLGPK